MMKNFYNIQKIIFSCRSEIGSVRKQNEDNFFCSGKMLNQEKISLHGATETPCIFAVCDGMGGEAHGELASFTVVNVLNEHSERIKSAAMSKNENNLDETIQDFISDSNNRLCDIMRKNAFRMGTTLALAVITDNVVKAYNIGDSRIYKFQDGTLSQISEDHTVAEQKIKMGLLTKEEARHDKSKHVLTRCLGIFEDEMILTPNIITPFNVNKECRLMICSDGLTDMLTDKDIENIFKENQNTSQTTNILVNNALKNGGRDNVTCILIDFLGE